MPREVYSEKSFLKPLKCCPRSVHRHIRPRSCQLGRWEWGLREAESEFRGEVPDLSISAVSAVGQTQTSPPLAASSCPHMAGASLGACTSRGARGKRAWEVLVPAVPEMHQWTCSTGLRQGQVPSGEMANVHPAGSCQKRTRFGLVFGF